MNELLYEWKETSCLYNMKPTIPWKFTFKSDRKYNLKNKLYSYSQSLEELFQDWQDIRFHGDIDIKNIIIKYISDMKDEDYEKNNKALYEMEKMILRTENLSLYLKSGLKDSCATSVNGLLSVFLYDEYSKIIKFLLILIFLFFHIIIQVLLRKCGSSFKVYYEAKSITNIEKKMKTVRYSGCLVVMDNFGKMTTSNFNIHIITNNNLRRESQNASLPALVALEKKEILLSTLWIKINESMNIASNNFKYCCKSSTFEKRK